MNSSWTSSRTQLSKPDNRVMRLQKRRKIHDFSLRVQDSWALKVCELDGLAKPVLLWMVHRAVAEYGELGTTAWPCGHTAVCSPRSWHFSEATKTWSQKWSIFIWRFTGLFLKRGGESKPFSYWTEPPLPKNDFSPPNHQNIGKILNFPSQHLFKSL